VQQLSSRTDEGAPGQILAVAGLFPDEHQRRVQAALPENSLRCVTVEVAASAMRRGGAQIANARFCG